MRRKLERTYKRKILQMENKKRICTDNNNIIGIYLEIFYNKIII